MQQVHVAVIASLACQINQEGFRERVKDDLLVLLHASSIKKGVGCCMHRHSLTTMANAHDKLII